jgi:hypothetical protein
VIKSVTIQPKNQWKMEIGKLKMFE